MRSSRAFSVRSKRRRFEQIVETNQSAHTDSLFYLHHNFPFELILLILALGFLYATSTINRFYCLHRFVFEHICLYNTNSLVFSIPNDRPLLLTCTHARAHSQRKRHLYRTTGKRTVNVLWRIESFQFSQGSCDEHVTRIRLLRVSRSACDWRGKSTQTKQKTQNC